MLGISTGDASSESTKINKATDTLRDITVQIKRGQLVAIVGNVGCGKSSFLSALLGEMHLKSGRVAVAENTSISYCDQRAFVVNASVKDNILFDSAFDEQRFADCLSVACLHDDIKSFTNGVLTEIGERGITLSGAY
jgi:ATP-binding cassette subfamily C (CFTR/MRP) protein 1